ncbi:hypothetical protein EW146_g1969 [Bondarzewia mesenterica]|uniref:Zn(2)-C6 fungal-type domain-containing protein n=1 Tax=Bondarzewia mesenterica TaxID=1095465 RepID=A0A4S4M4D5_9AGAM|nr:hypothetical protein EW146_g1969 [Bondarzewia mesenterica]
MSAQSSPEAFTGRLSSVADTSPQSHHDAGSMERSEHTSEKRVPLACHRCRAKRGRCTGEKPVCGTCTKAEAECTWPEGRRRKRTRKEMEEEERLERERLTSLHGAGSSRVLVPSPSEATTSPASVYWQDSPRTMPSSAGTPRTWEAPSSADRAIGWHAGEGSSSTAVVHRSTVSVRAAGGHVPAHPSALPNDPAVLARGQHFTPSAPIDNDPADTRDLELYYYRFSGQPGSTAIHPGINRISLRLQSRGNASRSTAAAPVPSDDAVVVNPPVRMEEMFDEQDLPHPHLYLPLLDAFFRTLSQHFPSVSRKRMEERLETKTMSAFLLNCICAISARFQDANADDPPKACAPFITKAQELVTPLLHLPTTDVVTGLLLLAWANYGQNSESGFWQYSGMAFRMALDLGLHEVSEIYESSAHVIRTRSCSRVQHRSTPSIQEEIVEIPLPDDADFFPDPARTNDPAAANEPVEPVPFHFLVRLMVLCGRIATVLNGQRGRSRTLAAAPATTDALSSLQKQLMQFYSSLPESLKWSVNTFKHQEARGHGGTFLALHAWANSVMALTYHPELTSIPLGTPTQFTQNVDRSIKLALSCSRFISECLLFADLFSSTSYLASPLCVQPIFIASSAFIHDLKTTGLEDADSDPNTSAIASSMLGALTRKALDTLTNALQRMDHYWAGINYVSTILEQRATELGYQVDLSSRARRTFIALPDQGLLHRFTGKWNQRLSQLATPQGLEVGSDQRRGAHLDPNLPHDTAPPNETSLRASMAREALERSQHSYTLDDLLSSYSIEELFVQPAGSLDLEQLLTI